MSEGGGIYHYQSINYDGNLFAFAVLVVSYCLFKGLELWHDMLLSSLLK